MNFKFLKYFFTKYGKTWNLNVIPTEAEAGFDIRVPPNQSMEDMNALLDSWTSEEGCICTFSKLNFEFFFCTKILYLTKNPLQQHYITPVSSSVDSSGNQIFEEATKAAGITVCPEVFPAATDSRFLRQKKIAAFGFSPMSATPILLHEHDEWIGEKTFLSGIDIYSKMLPIIVNAPILIDE
eukprot:GSMAST32.ASY1.ANO1.831.1 assembled CDS